MGKGHTSFTHLPKPGYLHRKAAHRKNPINDEIMKTKNKDRVIFYLASEDKKLLVNQCELLQIKASFYVRNCVLEKLGKPIFEVNKKDLNVTEYTSQLIKIGVNLNQISKKLNSGVKFMIADQKVVLDEIEAIKNHILEIKSQL